MLPENPDQSALKIREELEQRFGIRIGVVITDTHGRPFRVSACGVAIGASGISVFKNYIGLKDRAGRIMVSSVQGVADEIASAASLLMGQGDEGIPVVIIRGLKQYIGDSKAIELLRSPDKDLFYQAMANSDTLKEEESEVP
jgi:coenzyme F420-0:L-glutamate ligase/coenzyme F420-1:gamma-L-glutamate ligase